MVLSHTVRTRSSSTGSRGRTSPFHSASAGIASTWGTCTGPWPWSWSSRMGTSSSVHQVDARSHRGRPAASGPDDLIEGLPGSAWTLNSRERNESEPPRAVTASKGWSRLIAAAVPLFVLTACSPNPDLPTLAEALEAQPEGRVEPGDAFVIGAAEAPCGFPRHTELQLVDEGDGSGHWSRAIPWSPDDPAVVDGVIVAVSRMIDGNPPSVTAIDARTGAPLWQRFFASETLGLAATLSDGVVVDVASGSVLARLGGEAVVAATGRQVVIVDERGVAVSYGGGSRDWRSGPVARPDFDDPDAVMANDDTIVVLLGSHLGPNRRLVVLDAATGAQRWMLDGVRDAMLSGGVVVCDVRRGSAPEPPTREVVVVDALTGERLFGAATGRPLGGFVGRTSRGAYVFAGLEAGQVELVDGPSDAPVELFAEADPDPLARATLVTDALVAVARRTTLEAHDAEGEHVWQTATDQEIRSIAATPHGILVTSGDADYGCE